MLLLQAPAAASPMATLAAKHKCQVLVPLWRDNCFVSASAVLCCAGAQLRMTVQAACI